jgi:nicotinamidase-related amidase
MSAVQADPYEFDFDPATTALVVIDMQRDFVEPGGFGEALGNDVSFLRRTIAPIRRVLDAARRAGMLVIHTREGHRPDLSDLPRNKKLRGHLKTGIGDADKPGKGAFYATDLDAMLKNRGISQLVVCGVTTEVCVHTTVREANDRGYDCLVLEDCVGSYFPEFQEVGIKMIKAQGGIFGWVSDSKRFLEALGSARV